MSAKKSSHLSGADEDLVYSSVENTNRNFNSNSNYFAYSDNNAFRRSS